MASPDLTAPTHAYPSVLVSTELTTSEVAVYTPSGSQATKIEKGVICNISAAIVNVSIGVVPVGGTAGAAHHVLHNYPLPSGASFPLDDYLKGLWLGPGDFISAIAAVGADVVLTISGTVFS